MYQAFREPNERLEHLEAISHTQSDQNVVFMDDIESLFPRLTALRKRSIAVTKAKIPATSSNIDPTCIKFQPDVVLEVVTKEPFPSGDKNTETSEYNKNAPSAPVEDYRAVNSVQSSMEISTLHNTSAASATPDGATVSALDDAAGQIPKANAIIQGVKTLQQELQTNFSYLHSEMAKNGVLQNQILDMPRPAETMAQRMLELQQRTVQMQQQAQE
ncbi:hypothetical protein BGX33_011808 [Mortierella sp. NVP41]|nr:hypothetical protein BGX33_011808 [Mortierella sp. NVP41]